MMPEWIVRWAGEGRHLWSVRVDLIAPDGDGSRVAVAHESLFGLLVHDDGPGGHPGSGFDQGIGREGRPVIGFTLPVRADDGGRAATTGLAIAQAAGPAAASVLSSTTWLSYRIRPSSCRSTSSKSRCLTEHRTADRLGNPGRRVVRFRPVVLRWDWHGANPVEPRHRRSLVGRADHSATHAEGSVHGTRMGQVLGDVLGDCTSPDRRRLLHADRASHLVHVLAASPAPCAKAARDNPFTTKYSRAVFAEWCRLQSGCTLPRSNGFPTNGGPLPSAGTTTSPGPRV
jgi:hypothetical protein